MCVGVCRCAVIQVFVVDDDGDDVAVCYRLTGVVFGHTVRWITFCRWSLRC